MGPIPESALAFQNADVLRAIRDLQPDATAAAVARATGRDLSNLGKTLAKLEKAGVLTREPLDITEAAGAILAAADVAEGRVPVHTVGESGAHDPNLLHLAHAEIRPDPNNARKDWDSEAAKADLEALAADIADRGLLQNLIVRRDPAAAADPAFILVGGERRWRAIGLLKARDQWPGKPERSEFIPCRLLETDDIGHRLAALAENLQRRQLNPIEEAQAYQGLRDAGLSAEDIGRRVSVTARQVQMRLQLLQLTEADQQRMTLPKDDPRFLSVSDARNLVRRAQERADQRAALQAELTPRQRLILAEIRLAQLTADPKAWWYVHVPVRAAAAAADPDLAAMREKRLLDLRGPDDEGAVTVCPEWQGVHSAIALFGEGKQGPAAEAVRLAGELGIQAPSDGYAVPWLNGPFEVDEAIRAAIEARRAAEAAREAEWKAQREADAQAKAAERARMVEVHARARAERELLAANPDTRPQSDVVVQVAQALEQPLPWAHDGEGGIYDAAGEEVMSLHYGWGDPDPTYCAQAELIVLSVNSAAGLATPAMPVKAEDEDEGEGVEDDDDPESPDEPGSEA